MSDYQVIARKYRPQRFKEVIGQDAIVQTLKNALLSKKTAHAYLFSGPRGTGKTTLARILAKALNCEKSGEDLEPCTECSICKEIGSGSSIDVLEIDGASHRGIDDIRAIADSVGYAPTGRRYKIYIIDEVHMLTKEAFNALLKTLEEPPANVKFFFATTEAHKVPPTILSRCQRFNLQRIPLPLITKKLSAIAQELAVTFEERALFDIARYASGGLRDAESLLDQIIAFSGGSISCSLVEEILGTLPRKWFFSLDEAAATTDMVTAIKIAKSVFMQGKDSTHFLEDLHAHYRSILLTQLGCGDLIEYSDDDKGFLAKSSTIYTQEQCLTILEWIQSVQQSIKNSLSEEITLETLLVKIVRVRLRVPIDYITRRLVALEQKIIHSGKERPPSQEQISAPVIEPEIAASTTSTHSSPKNGILALSKKPEVQTLSAAVIKPEITASATPTNLAPKEEVDTLPRKTEAQKPPIANEQQRKVRQDTLLQFAAVELKGTIQKK